MNDSDVNWPKKTIPTFKNVVINAKGKNLNINFKKKIEPFLAR